jgi:tetratricopeptide (TPR) repeat protein
MKEPSTVAEVKALHEMRRSDPQKYLKIVDDWIKQNPSNHRAYFDRHFAWMRLGEPRRALADMDKSLELSPDPLAYFSRAEVHKHLGEYGRALDDFGRSEAMMPGEWEDLGFGLLQQADCHARLGDEANALACCARLTDDFWTPGMSDAPAGDKVAVAEKLKVIAAQARREHRQ